MHRLSARVQGTGIPRTTSHKLPTTPSGLAAASVRRAAPPPQPRASCQHPRTRPLRARPRPVSPPTDGAAPQPLSHANQRSPTPAPGRPQRAKRPSTLTAAAPAAPGGQPRDPWSPSCRRALSWVKWPASFRRGLEPPHSGSTSSLIAMARSTDGARALRAAPGPGTTPGRRQAERPPTPRSGSPPPDPEPARLFWPPPGQRDVRLATFAFPAPTSLASQPTRPQAAGRGPPQPARCRPQPHGGGSAVRPHTPQDRWSRPSRVTRPPYPTPYFGRLGREARGRGQQLKAQAPLQHSAVALKGTERRQPPALLCQPGVLVCAVTAQICIILSYMIKAPSRTLSICWVYPEP